MYSVFEIKISLEGRGFKTSVFFCNFATGLKFSFCFGGDGENLGAAWFAK
jgi:hypothetical protein